MRHFSFNSECHKQRKRIREKHYFPSSFIICCYDYYLHVVNYCLKKFIYHNDYKLTQELTFLFTVFEIYLQLFDFWLI